MGSTMDRSPVVILQFLIVLAFRCDAQRMYATVALNGVSAASRFSGDAIDTLVTTKAGRWIVNVANAEKIRYKLDWTYASGSNWNPDIRVHECTGCNSIGASPCGSSPCVSSGSYTGTTATSYLEIIINSGPGHRYQLSYTATCRPGYSVSNNLCTISPTPAPTPKPRSGRPTQ
jgi:hypothetical protein